MEISKSFQLVIGLVYIPNFLPSTTTNKWVPIQFLRHFLISYTVSFTLWEFYRLWSIFFPNIFVYSVLLVIAELS